MGRRFEPCRGHLNTTGKALESGLFLCPPYLCPINRCSRYILCVKKFFCSSTKNKKAVKYIEDFLETDGQYLEDLLYLTRGNQLYTEDGDELYIDPTSQKRTLHNQYEPGFIVARDKSPLELLIENKELFDK
ncbi:hypothetical protein HMPREF2655_06695 [Streptococcus sp. HMSC066F01]|nr:hypothetical protein HMPREF2655_06695 [Streptococcus sp. HMSC066F01]